MYTRAPLKLNETKTKIPAPPLAGTLTATVRAIARSSLSSPPLLAVAAALCLSSAQGAMANQINAESGELLYSTEGNRVRRYDIDTIGTADLNEDILIERARIDPEGRDLNGEMCFFPDGTGRFVAGEDTGQPNPPAGWGVFAPDGTQLQKLTATYFVPGAEPHGCEFSPNGSLFTSEVGFQGFGTANGQLIQWFPGLESFCKLAIDLAVAGSVEVDAQGRVYVTQAAGGTIERFSPPFPTSNTAEGGCGGVDSTGAPVADSVNRETFVTASQGMATFSGITKAPNGNFYASSVLTGRIAEYDLDGNLVRLILAPEQGVPPIPTGHPQGLDVGSDGTLYYADLDLVGTLPNVGAGPDGRVWRIRFDEENNPLPPEVVRAGLSFPDGVSVGFGNFQTPDTTVPDWPTLAGGPSRTFFNANEQWLKRDRVDDLVEKWRFPTNAVVTSSPSVAPVTMNNGETKRIVFSSSWDGFIYAIDFVTGEEVWRFAWEDQPGASFPAAGSVTVADVDGDRLVFVGAGEVVYALNAADGAERWRFYAGTGCKDPITGEPPGLCAFNGERNQVETTPLVSNNTVYFGMDINDVDTGKGGFYALDARDGRLTWYFDTETGQTCRPDPSDNIRNFDGYHSAAELGLPDDFFATRSGCGHDRQPTGCGNIWSSAAHDPARNMLYFGTSNCDTDNNPATPSPGPTMPPYDEALVALGTDGVPAWRWRPREIDPDDLAFGAVPNLFTMNVNGSAVDVVGIGGKDGVYYTIDRDGINEQTGVSWDDENPRSLPYWETKVVPGGAIGGIIATASVDQDAGRIYFSTAPGLNVIPPQRPVVHSLDIDTGEIIWQSTETDFSGGDASYAPASAVPEVLLIGSVITPHLRMYSTEDGTLLYDKIIGEPGTASGIASGAAVVDGTIIVGAGIGARSSGGSSPGDFAANSPSAVIALCVPGSPDCPGPPPAYIPGFSEVIEGDAGTTVAQVPITLSFPTHKRVEIEWRVLSEVEQFAGQLVAASGTVVFEPGETEATISVEVIGDTIPEERGAGVIAFHPATNATAGGFFGLGFVLVEDDDAVSVN
ncbi:MAG: PQQ-binding-like beta-propeller repeat protein [Halioglobus sp.]